MEVARHLEVDVNGEETFLVDKKILSSFSGKLDKLFSKYPVMADSNTLKVVLHDLPGGPETFELLVRFCYNNGKIQLTPINTCLLHCAAHFMEMTSGLPLSPSLIKETEKSLEGIPYWMWSELLVALKQCQDFFLIASSFGVLEKLLDSLVGRIVTPTTDTSPSGSSPESSAFRFSFDTRSTASTKTHQSWWFEDLVGFSLPIIEKATKNMILRKVDHVTVSRFLFYYLKARLANATVEEKRNVIETVVDHLYSLDHSSVSCRSLFGILRVSLSQNLSKCCRSKLESMIGVQFDRVTLDSLLVPAQSGTENLYDVDLVLRFLKSFLSSSRGQEAIARLKRVGSLIDLYLAEVAPDSGLRPMKFVALATTLPDAARDSHDAMYRAIDMYLEVHARLAEEEKMKICCAINLEKLSTESCKHLAQNTKFPSRTAIQALLSQQSRLKSLLEDTNDLKSFDKGTHSISGEQVILYAKKVDLSAENEELRVNLQGMQWRVMELEKVCKKMQTQMARMTKNKVPIHGSPRSLPKLCS